MCGKRESAPELTHFDAGGRAIMVDIGGKTATRRRAVAAGIIRVSPPALEAVRQGSAAKGDVLGVARVAGIQAAKRTSELIPLCHTLALTKCTVNFETDETAGEITAICTAETTGQTGVEMEVLTGVSAALLTIYDMCKAIDKGMVITEIRLLEKHGGRSGSYADQTEREPS